MAANIQVSEQTHGNGREHDVLPAQLGAEVQLQLDQNDAAHDGVRVNHGDGYSTAHAITSIQNLVVEMLVALHTLQSNYQLNHVDIQVNGQTTRITRNNLSLFHRAVTILHPVHQHLVAGLNVPRRGLYYYYCHRYGKKAGDKYFSGTLKSVTNAVGVPVRALNIKDESNSYGYGQAVIQIQDKDGHIKTIDLSEREDGALLGDEPICADMKLGNVSKVSITAKDGCCITRLIIIEKYCLFVQMTQMGWDIPMNAILLCSKGFPSKSDKAWARLAVGDLHIEEKNCGVVHDFNPHGYALGNEYQRNTFNGYEKYTVRLGHAGIQHALLKNFQTVVDMNRDNNEHKYKDSDWNMLKHLFKPETRFYEEVNDERFLELVNLYNCGFKFDLDAIVVEYGIEYLLKVLTKVFKNNLML